MNCDLYVNKTLFTQGTWRVFEVPVATPDEKVIIETLFEPEKPNHHLSLPFQMDAFKICADICEREKGTMIVYRNKLYAAVLPKDMLTPR